MLGRFVALIIAMSSTVAIAQPVTLKLSFFSSDRSHLYLSGIKPFVDAVNLEGKGRVQIEPYLSGRLGNLEQLSQAIRDGVVDIGYVIPPYERAIFSDATVVELPGMYKDAAEATRVFWWLLERDRLRGFADFLVIGAFASEPESIHLRPPVATLADLKDKIVRANNPVEVQVLQRLGAKPSIVAINLAAQAISAGEIDGAYAPLVPMIEFGIGRVAQFHYLLRTSCVPQILLMNRKKFESLPSDVQELIRRYSGQWLVETYIRINNAVVQREMDGLLADPRRTVVFPSEADMKTADEVFKKVVDGFAAQSAHNADLVETARSAAKILSSNK